MSSRILGNFRPRLLNCGFDCDIYKISDFLVYKHYAPYKLGAVLYKRRPPTEFLETIDSPYVERVIDSDDEGFVTDLARGTCGSFLFYRPEIILQPQTDSFKFISEFLQVNHHNDISPDNLLIIRGRVVLSDWCNREEEPYYSFLSDQNSMRNWLECMKGRTTWFSPVNHKQLQIFCLKSGLKYVITRQCFNPHLVALYVNRYIDSQKIIEKCKFNGSIPFDIYFDLFEFFLKNYGEILKENLRKIWEIID